MTARPRVSARPILRALVVGVCGLVAACGSTATSSSSTAPTPAPTRAPLVIGEREAVSPDPAFDLGFTVHVTDRGFQPQWLVAPCCKAITWKNLTGHAVQVVFDHQPVDSGPIPPGGTFAFTPPNVESIAYHEGGNPDVAGVLQVNQTQE